MKQIVRFIDKPGSYRLTVPFSKEGEEGEVLIMILASQKGEFEFDILVDHSAPKTAGRVVIKGLSDNGAHLKVGGTIKIRKNCNLVNDFLEMRMLILDNNSWAEAQPRLEIESADVKASHAAAVSRVSDEEIFYLNSRGINKEDARAMLIEGFLREVMSAIEDEKIKETINSKLIHYGYSKD
jgi:Fe-S cluster assembly protein SufD